MDRHRRYNAKYIELALSLGILGLLVLNPDCVMAEDNSHLNQTLSQEARGEANNPNALRSCNQDSPAKQHLNAYLANSKSELSASSSHRENSHGAYSIGSRMGATTYFAGELSSFAELRSKILSQDITKLEPRSCFKNNPDDPMNAGNICPRLHHPINAFDPPYPNQKDGWRQWDAGPWKNSQRVQNHPAGWTRMVVNTMGSDLEIIRNKTSDGKGIVTNYYLKGTKEAVATMLDRDGDGFEDTVTIFGKAMDDGGYGGSMRFNLTPNPDTIEMMAEQNKKRGNPNGSVASAGTGDIKQVDVWDSQISKALGYSEIHKERSFAEKCAGINGDPIALLNYFGKKLDWTPSSTRMSNSQYVSLIAAGAGDGARNGAIGWGKGMYNGGKSIYLLGKMIATSKGRADLKAVVNKLIEEGGPKVKKAWEACSESTNNDYFLTLGCVSIWGGDEAARKIYAVLKEKVMECADAAYNSGTDEGGQAWGECMGAISFQALSSAAGVGVVKAGSAMSTGATSMTAAVTGRALTGLGWGIDNIGGFGLSGGANKLALLKDSLKETATQVEKLTAAGALKELSDVEKKALMSHLESVAKNAVNPKNQIEKLPQELTQKLLAAEPEILDQARKSAIESVTKKDLVERVTDGLKGKPKEGTAAPLGENLAKDTGKPMPSANEAASGGLSAKPYEGMSRSDYVALRRSQQHLPEKPNGQLMSSEEMLALTPEQRASSAMQYLDPGRSPQEIEKFKLSLEKAHLLGSDNYGYSVGENGSLVTQFPKHVTDAKAEILMKEGGLTRREADRMLDHGLAGGLSKEEVAKIVAARRKEFDGAFAELQKIADAGSPPKDFDRAQLLQAKMNESWERYRIGLQSTGAPEPVRPQIKPRATPKPTVKPNAGNLSAELTTQFTNEKTRLNELHKKYYGLAEAIMDEDLANWQKASGIAVVDEDAAIALRDKMSQEIAAAQRKYLEELELEYASVSAKTAAANEKHEAVREALKKMKEQVAKSGRAMPLKPSELP